MASLRDYMYLTAAALGLLAHDNNRRDYYPTEQDRRNSIVCGMCKHFPKGTFCKMVNHRVGKATPAYKCEHFKNKDDE